MRGWRESDRVRALQKGGGGSGGSGRGGGGGSDTAESIQEQLRAAGVPEGLALQNELKEIQKLNTSDPADQAYKAALLSPRSGMANGGSALDRISYQRRLSEKTKLTKDDAISAASNFSQGFYNTGTQFSRTANIEYTLRVYNRLSASGKNVFAQNLKTNPQLNASETSNRRLAKMVNDVSKRRDKFANIPSKKISKGKQAANLAAAADDDFFANL